MKILLVTEDFPPQHGGVFTFLHNLCRFSTAQISVLATDSGVSKTEHFDADQSYPIERIHLPAHGGFLSLLAKAYGLAFRLRPDVIFWGHATSAAIIGLWLARRLHVHFAILIHGTEMSASLAGGWLPRRFLLSALRGADPVFVNSHDTAKRVDRLGVSPHKLHVLNPGVDVQHFQPGLVTSELVQRYGLTHKRVLLTVARLFPKKNHAAILKVLPEVLKVIPNTIYVIVGDGPEETHLRQLRDHMALQNHVIMVPHTTGTALVRLYNLCDVFVMVSRTTYSADRPQMPLDIESFGISFIEAGACGKPVIGGRSGGVSDAVVDGETGLLVDPEDVEAIARAITRLLTDDALAHRLGHNGRRRAVQMLSWETVAARFDDALADCISGCRPISEEGQR